MPYDPLDTTMPRAPKGWRRVCKGHYQDHRRKDVTCWIIRNQRTGVYAATWDGTQITRVTNRHAEACIAASRESGTTPDLRTQLRAAIADSGLTQTELAERTGIAQPSISRMLSDRQESMDLASAERLASAIGRPLTLADA